MPLVVAKAPATVEVKAETVSGDGLTAEAVVEESVAATAKPEGPDMFWTLFAFIVVIGASLLAWGLYEWIEPNVFVAAAGFSAFAPLLILAQGIERFLEPFSDHLGRAKDEDGKTKTKKTATDDRNKAFAKLANLPRMNSVDVRGNGQAKVAPQEEGEADTVESAAKDAAKKQGFLDRVRQNAAVVAWALASALAMLACGAFGVLLLGAIGFDVPPYWDIALTGLAVGSGTKPLHDLISNIEKSKEAKADKPAAAT